LDNQNTIADSHNAYLELLVVFKQRFTLRQINPDEYFKCIPTGDLELRDYDTGLSWLKLFLKKSRADDSGKTITVLIGNVDDGFWRAFTPPFESQEEAYLYLEKLRVVLDKLRVLPNSENFDAILSAACPLISKGEID
jgi:hypothetical protein